MGENHGHHTPILSEIPLNPDKQNFTLSQAMVAHASASRVLEKRFLKEGIYVVQTDLELSV